MHLNRSEKVALHTKMKSLGFRPVADNAWTSGLRQIVRLVGGEFAPWATFWNPGVYFDTPEAAVVWAEAEGWGTDQLTQAPVFKGQLGSLESVRIVETVNGPDARGQG